MIGLAENDVLNFVYPLEGNEQIMALIIETCINGSQLRLLSCSIRSNTFIAGPFDLFQGGQAAPITRTPIFRDPPFNQN
ncbi:hypothetical protein OH492_15875 [Vibrio chagasii]|nr:hypothetical protein [Vibrio chagasii]